MARPNIFAFATSELSQDAFICWLLSWSERSLSDSHGPLHRTALLLLDRLLERGRVKPPNAYERVAVRKQVQRIDVLVEVNDKLAVIIEDKTFTAHHSGQLERYLADVGRRYSRENIAAIYLKTGDQSSYAEIENAGYSPFRRSDLLNVLDTGKQLGVRSEIFQDFHDHLAGLEQAVAGFRLTPIGDWDGSCWTGFFIELQKRLGDGEWDYVPNPSGGFMGFWWHWCENKYLQLEQDRLCFKIAVEDKTLQTSAWEQWHDVLAATVGSGEFILKRARKRTGTWMTVAVLEGDYRRANGGVIDLDRTVEVLRRAERQLDAAAANA